MRPVLFEVLGWPLRSFGVLVALGFLVGLIWTRREARRSGRDPDLISDLFLWVLIGGVIGARVLFVAVQFDQYRPGGSPGAPAHWGQALWAMLKMWEGGLVYYGGLLGAVVAGVVCLLRRREPIVALADLSAPGVWLGQAIGRIGCFCVGDDYGRPADLPWAVTFPDVDHSLMAPELIGIPVHPTQLYLSLNALLVFAVAALLRRRPTRTGTVAGIALIQYSIGRFWIEFFRADDAARGMYSGLATSQWISIPVLLVGVLLVTGRFGRQPTRAAAAAD